jgi:hypothetical protein
MIRRILNSWKNLGSRVKQHLRQWTKPVTAILVTGILSDMTRSRADLIAENAILRQQLIVLNRQVKRPRLANADLCWLLIPSAGLGGLQSVEWDSGARTSGLCNNYHPGSSVSLKAVR